MLKNVSKIYGEGSLRVDALDSVTLNIHDGEFVAITGPSGSGKSTLLNVVGGLDNISNGEVVLDGQRIDSMGEGQLVNIRRTKIAYVFQQYYLLPSLTALENILLPLTFRGSRRDDEDRALDLLNKVGLANRASHKPSQLSGGEQQRVAIARALINNCSLILADEPTGNLDQKTGMEIIDLFTKLNADGYAIMMVTHNSETAHRAKRVISMKDGQIVGDTLRKRGRRWDSNHTRRRRNGARIVVQQSGESDSRPVVTVTLDEEGNWQLAGEQCKVTDDRKVPNVTYEKGDNESIADVIRQEIGDAKIASVPHVEGGNGRSRKKTHKKKRNQQPMSATPIEVGTASDSREHSENWGASYDI
ncbi:MAG: ABC transporter ATP-binding protein [Chloroflexota bacterium]|nr:ABC transporter ATP-binding protein [Chloroflexota bacterium]